MRGFRLGLCLAVGILTYLGPAYAEKNPESNTPSVSSTRLVMIQVPEWKMAFFGLPAELPLLLQPGESFNPKAGHYDFAKGMEAMRVFLALRPKDKAAPAFERFLKKWPHYQEFFQALDQEELTRAQDHLDAIRTLEPKEPAVHFYQGSLNMALKKYAEAESEYKTCLEIFPDYGPTYINLARLARARGAVDEARNTLRMAIPRLEATGQDDVKAIAVKMLESLAP